MNIAFFTRPKQEITYLYDDFTVRQALEKMHSSSYTAVPVVDRAGHYIATVTEGDLLWFIVKGEGGEPHTISSSSSLRISVLILTRISPYPSVHQLRT